MTRGSTLLKAAAALAIGFSSLSVPAATAADYIEAIPAADAGFCANTGVLGRIQSKFRHQVTHVPNLPNVAISEFQNISVTRWQPQAEENPIPRLYCNATVNLSDGNQRKIWYLVEEGMGLAGTGYNVEFCVDGFDRWNVYSGACRILR